jgi:hypothetical protein
MTIVTLMFHQEYILDSTGKETKKITYTWKGPQTGVVEISGELWRDADPLVFSMVTSTLSLESFAYDFENDIIYMSKSNKLYFFVWLYYRVSCLIFGAPSRSELKYAKDK